VRYRATAEQVTRPHDDTVQETHDVASDRPSPATPNWPSPRPPSTSPRPLRGSTSSPPGRPSQASASAERSVSRRPPSTHLHAWVLGTRRSPPRKRRERFSHVAATAAAIWQNRVSPPAWQLGAVCLRRAGARL